MPRNSSVVKQFYAATSSSPLPALSPVVEKDYTSPVREALDEMVIGQEDAKDAICEIDCVIRAGLAPNGRPAGSIFLLGPSGCGKTRLVESYAKALHGSVKHVLVVHCAEYSHGHEIAKILGSPPGYLGHRDTIPFLSQSRMISVTSDRSPYSIVLFDEFEKAHADLQKLLLGVLDKGVLRLGDNNTVNFERSIIFFTSNIGTEKINRLLSPEISGGIGYSRPELSEDEISRKLSKLGVGELSKEMKTELINRLDKIVVCHPLTREDTRRIVALHLEETNDFILSRWGVRSPEIKITPEAWELIFEMSYDPRWGAREIKRVVQQQILLPIARLSAVHGHGCLPDWKLTFTRGAAGVVMEAEQVSAPGTVRGKKAANY